jgi:hypothetical protein
MAVEAGSGFGANLGFAARCFGMCRRMPPVSLLAPGMWSWMVPLLSVLWATAGGMAAKPPTASAAAANRKFVWKRKGLTFDNNGVE